MLIPNWCSAQESTIPSVELELGDSPEETYDLNALDFIERRRTRFSILGIPFSRQSTWVPVVGKYRYDLDYDAFFERVGAPELARKQRSTNTWSTVLSVGGLAMIMVGIFTPLALKNDNQVTTTGLVVGGSIAFGGLVISSAGPMMWRQVITASEARELAESYNTSLAERIRRGEADTRMQHSLTLPISGSDWIGYQLQF